MTIRANKKLTSGLLHDREWINDCFLLPRNPSNGSTKISDTVLQWMYYTTADLKFTNTSLGGNFTVNNPPQYTTFADPPTGRMMTDSSKKALEAGMSQGMGQYYSEAIDDNAERVTMRFGVPEYKGLVTFFTGFYNANASILGNEGRVAAGLFYLVGRVVGAVVALPLTIVMAIGKAAKFFFNRPSTKYYWLKPAMPLYWNRVNKVVNRVAAEMGLVPDTWRDPKGKDPLAEYDMMDTTSDSALQNYSFNVAKQYFPELFSDSGGIDIYRVVNKTSRMSNHLREQLIATGEGATSKNGFAESVKKHLQGVSVPAGVSAGKPLEEWLEAYHKSVLGATELEGVDGETVDLIRRNGVLDRVRETAELDGTGTFGDMEVGTAQEDRANALGDAPEGEDAKAALAEYQLQDNLILSVLRTNAENVLERADGWVSDQGGTFAEYVSASLARGADWISFKVEATESVSESWNNSTVESDIQSSINGVSRTVRGAAFNFANFKSGFGIIDGPIQAMKDMIYGAMDSFQISGLLALAGSGMVDIPLRYDDSSSSVFESNSYTIELRSAYGDPMSIFLNIYVPFLCLLAAACPISHGNQSYGAPMLCELFHRGRATVRLGIIESLSVTRGAGTVGWNQDGLPLGVDITFSVKNLSSMMHMPIDTGLQSMMPWNALFGDDNLYSDYTAVLSNLSIVDQTHPWKKYAINLRRYKIDIDNYFNSARLGNWLGNKTLFRIIASTNKVPPRITTL